MQTLVQVVVDGDGDGEPLTTHSVVWEVESQEERLEGGDAGDGREAKASCVADTQRVAHPFGDCVRSGVGQVQVSRLTTVSREQALGKQSVN